MDQERFDSREVREARDRVADDLRDVADNADAVRRSKDTIGDRIESAKSAAQGAMSSAQDALGNLRPSENPMLMLLGGLAAGFLIGMIVPISRFENERLGPVAGDLKSRMREAGVQAARRGGEVIKESIEAATESAAASRQSARDF
jgi:hypothetical protein